MSIKNIEELFEITKQTIEGKTGTISINFANRTHIYEARDIIGNCLQEWLPNWFEHLGVDLKKGASTQEFPDFIATFEHEKYDVEIKAWNYVKRPAFDLANFHGFIDATYKDPNKLNAVYFVLGYRLSDDGFSEGFIVEKVYMKHIWQLTAPSIKYPVGLQVKREQPYAIRPYSFHTNPNGSFASREDFIFAIKETFKMFPNNTLPFDANNWYGRVMSYFKD